VKGFHEHSFHVLFLREDSGQIRSFYRMLRSALALCAIMGASAFAGMGLKLPHDANSRMALRSAGPSMKIGVFYGSTTGNTENVAVQVWPTEKAIVKAPDA
jgi:hypothetical protein